MTQKFLLILILCPALAYSSPTTNVKNLSPEFTEVIPTFVSTLPKCKGVNPVEWDECVGGYVYPNKNAYYGEWRGGERQGVGQLKVMAKGTSDSTHIRATAPAIYVGEFEAGRLKGHGVWIDKTGSRYEGEFSENLLIQENKLGVTVFGDDTDKFKNKCTSYGLKFGTKEFANCMLSQEKMANNNAQLAVTRAAEKESRERSRETKAIDWFRLANEFAQPRWIPDTCPSILNARPGQYPGCN